MLLSGEICLDGGKECFSVIKPAGLPVYQVQAMQVAFACNEKRNRKQTGKCSYSVLQGNLQNNMAEVSRGHSSPTPAIMRRTW